MVRMTVLTIDDSGTVTFPRETLLALGIDCRAEVEVEIEVDENIRSLRVTPHYDDSWADTEEMRAEIRQGLEDIKAGRVRQMSDEDLLRFVGLNE